MMKPPLKPGTFLQMVFVIFVFGSCSHLQQDIEPVTTAKEAPPNSPNFIILIADDLRYDALGFVQKSLNGRGRFPWVETPSLDSLAQSGISFKNAFVTSSLCSPSRASILTGMYAHNHGITDNWTHFNGESFASALAQSGYETAYFGKWHFGEQSGPRPGFDYSYSFIGQGEYIDGDFERNGQPESSYGWVDQVSSRSLIKQLDKEKEEPFCYILGFKSCHGPWDSPPEDFKKMYGGTKAQETPNLSTQAPYPHQPVNKENYDETFLWQDRNYFRYLSAIDSEIGKIANHVSEKKLENTYFIFISDNGFYMGEHQLRDKRTAYEESMRVPFIVSGPNMIKGREIEELVLNVDLAPTILDLVNLNVDWEMNGESLAPFFKGSTVPWRKSFIFQYFKEQYSGPPVNIIAVRNEKYKLITYPKNEQWNEFYDLIEDPFETNNIYKQEAFGNNFNEVFGQLKDESAKINFRLFAQ